MIKALLFDLDGVLVEFAKIHEQTFIDAWNRIYPEHLINNETNNLYLEARTTKSKIKVLNELFNIPSDSSKETEIFNLKQALTMQAIHETPVYSHTLPALEYAKSLGLKMAICSNSVKATVMESVEKLRAGHIFDIILSNNDVDQPKPYPEIYLKAMDFLRVAPNECLIFEDSDVGKQAALAALGSACKNLIPVRNAMDVTECFIKAALEFNADFFDDASEAWQQNKKRVGASYKYICSHIKKNGQQCKNSPYREYDVCKFHLE